MAFTPGAQKDARKAARSALRPKIERLLELLARDPFETPPPFEKLVGDLEGAFSRRVNIQHRLVYQVLTRQRVVKVLRMWTHYEYLVNEAHATMVAAIAREKQLKGGSRAAKLRLVERANPDWRDLSADLLR